MEKKARKTRRQLRALQQKKIDKANARSDPLDTLKSSHEYTTKDGQVIKLSCVRPRDADEKRLSWVFDLTERNMKTLYEQSQWGWDAKEKQTELTEEQAWYLIASSEEKLIGYSHFRFDMDDGEEVLYCYELQLEPEVRRKGLGRFMMKTLEAMAVQNEMRKVILTVHTHNPASMHFFHALGYKLDKTSPPVSNQSDFVILSKQNLRQ